MATRDANGNGWWRYTTTALAGVLLTLFSIWASGGFAGITRAEAVVLVKTQSPYVEDRKAMVESVRANSIAIAELTKQNRELSSQVARLVGELRARQ